MNLRTSDGYLIFGSKHIWLSFAALHILTAVRNLCSRLDCYGVVNACTARWIEIVVDVPVSNLDAKTSCKHLAMSLRPLAFESSMKLRKSPSSVSIDVIYLPHQAHWEEWVLSTLVEGKQVSLTNQNELPLDAMLVG